MLSGFSRVWLFVTPRTVACQAPLSLGILQARILESVAMPSSGDLPNPGIEPTFLLFLALPSWFFTTSAPWEALAEDAREQITRKKSSVIFPCHEWGQGGIQAESSRRRGGVRAGQGRSDRDHSSSVWRELGPSQRRMVLGWLNSCWPRPFLSGALRIQIVRVLSPSLMFPWASRKGRRCVRISVCSSQPPFRGQVRVPLGRSYHSHLPALPELMPKDCENSITGAEGDTEQVSQPSQGCGWQRRASHTGIFSCWLWWSCLQILSSWVHEESWHIRPLADTGGWKVGALSRGCYPERERNPDVL